MGDGRTHILLAEDDDDMRDMLQFWLEGEGYRVTSVADGREAIDAAREDPPDLAILDLLMPNVDGFQTCRFFREDEALGRIPVVMFTAVFLEPEEKEMGFDAGADDFVEKTSGFNALLASIRRIKGSGKDPRKIDLDPGIARLVKDEIDSKIRPKKSV